MLITLHLLAAVLYLLAAIAGAIALAAPGGRARRAAAANRAHVCGALVDRDREARGGARQDLLDVRGGVRLQALHDAEARAERRRQEALSRRCADEREWLHAESDAPSARARI